MDREYYWERSDIDHEKTDPLPLTPNVHNVSEISPSSNPINPFASNVHENITSIPLNPFLPVFYPDSRRPFEDKSPDVYLEMTNVRNNHLSDPDQDYHSIEGSDQYVDMTNRSIVSQLHTAPDSKNVENTERCRIPDIVTRTFYAMCVLYLIMGVLVLASVKPMEASNLYTVFGVCGLILIVVILIIILVTIFRPNRY